MRNALKLVFAAIMLTASPGNAADILAALDGKWSGSGWVKPKNGGERETVRCRVTGSYQNTGSRLSLNGKCASPGRSGRIDGFVEALDGGKSFSGRWANPLGAGSTTVRGLGENNTITFRFKVRDRETDEMVDGIMVWTVLADRFTIATGDVAAGGPSILSEIAFQR